MTPEASVLAQHRMERAAAACKEGDPPFEKRLSSDYSDFVEVGADEVERTRSDVRAFVDTCRQLLLKSHL